MKQLISFLFVLLAAHPIDAFEWRRGGLHGADVRSLVIAPDDPDHVYLGTSQGEIYVSGDGGRSWTNPRDSVPFPGYVIDNLAIDAHGDLWIAGWGLWGGGIVATSTDGAHTWERRDQGITELSIRAFSLVPNDNDAMIVGGLTGVYRSLDRGISWHQISSQENVESLAVDPRTADTIYVGTWRQMWRTDDGGASWQHIAKGMVLDTDVFGISIDPSNPDDVWLSTCGWVYHSKDRGDHWNRYRDGFQNRRVHVVTRDLTNPAAIWAGSVAGLYRTLDLGKSWELVTSEEIAINAIAIHPDRPLRMILGTEGDGVYVSEDRGETFERSTDGLFNVRVSAIAVDPLVEGRLLAATRFGRVSAVHESLDRGNHWSRLSESRLPPILTLENHRGEESARLIAGTESGIYFSDDGGKAWTRAEPSTTPMRVESILSYTKKRLFAGTADGVFTSNDGGSSWWRLDGSWIHAGGLAIGRWDDKPALFATHSDGLAAYNEDGWHDVPDSPGGSEIVIVNESDRELILLASSRKWSSGYVDNGRWEAAPAKIPDGAALEAIEGRVVRVESNGDRHLFIAEDLEGSPEATGMPGSAREVADIAIDPFDADIFYFATTGSGLLILERDPRIASLSYSK